MTRAAAVLDEVVKTHLKALKLPGVARVFRDLARQAKSQSLSHEEYLLELLEVETRSRTENVSRQRLREARFPSMKTIDQFDFALQPDLDRALILQLARCEWISRAQPILLAGPVGTGKTHLATAFGIEAATRRRRVRFYRADDLVRELTEAKGKHEVTRVFKRLDRVEVLIVDELGFVPFDQTGAELLFNLLASRYQRRATIITTNLAFSEWTKVFGDDKLTAALLDRLAEDAHVVTTAGSSYRMRRRASPDS